MNIEIGKTYFYNNSPVTVLKKETGDFSLVAGSNKVDTSVRGSEWCMACLAAPPGVVVSHSCDDYQSVVDAVIDDVSEKSIFWVMNRFLAEKPVEFVEWEKLIAEKKQVSLEKSNLQDELSLLQKNFNDDKEKLSLIKLTIEEMESKREVVQSELDFYSSQRDKIVANEESLIKINGSEITLTIQHLLTLLESTIILDGLKAGGVDNWEWYGESLPEDYKEQALNELVGLKS